MYASPLSFENEWIKDTRSMSSLPNYLVAFSENSKLPHRCFLPNSNCCKLAYIVQKEYENVKSNRSIKIDKKNNAKT